MRKWEKNLANMTYIDWDPKARDFLRKLPKDISRRIYKKVDTEIKLNVERYLETLVNIEGYKIRIGDYRLFVDYYKDKDHLVIRTIIHRKDAYKREWLRKKTYSIKTKFTSF